MSSPYFRGPKPSGKAASLTANERGKTPKAKPLDKAPRPIDKAPRPINKQPAPMNVPDYPGHSGGLGPVGHLLHNLTHPSHAPEAVRTRNKQGKVQPRQRDVSVGEQAASVIGVNPVTALRVLEHPVRFIQHQQHLSPQQKANSAIGAHLLGSLFAGGAAGRVEQKAVSRGQTLAMSGGGDEAKAEAKVALRGSLRGAKVVRGKQEAGYAEERAARFAKARTFLNDQSLEPEDRLRLAKNELKGELPKIDFQGMKVLDEQSVKELQKHILDHPFLMEGQKIRASDALSNALMGRVPTRGELQILEHVFGRENANSIGKIASHPYRQILLSALNIPRSLMASFDLSAPFRQGLVTATRHPVIFAKNFGPMIKSFGSERVYHDVLSEIRSRPTFPMMMEGGVSFTELGKQAGQREEQFQSDLAEQLNLRSIPGLHGKKYATGPGDVVKASGRAYTAFLDKMRADVFDHLLERAQTQTRFDRILGPLGRKPADDIHNEKFLKDLGRFVNSATGRGPLGTHLQGAATALNAFFFSPRLLASRLDLIFSPLTYAKADPFVRREALRSMFHLAGTASALIALASQIPGIKVVTDPRNPDWGKIKDGNTRFDIGGGFQQPLRLFAQLYTGVAISSTTGKKLNLTANGFGQPTRLDLVTRFFEGKESPWASFVTDKLRNSDQVGNKFHLGPELYSRVTPLLVQDTMDLYHDRNGGMNGIAAAFAGYGIGSIGFGLQTYGPKQPKPSKQDSNPYFGGSGSSPTSPYFQGDSGSSGSSPYFSGG